MNHKETQLEVEDVVEAQHEDLEKLDLGEKLGHSPNGFETLIWKRYGPTVQSMKLKGRERRMRLKKMEVCDLLFGCSFPR
jgi:hypothetical protein